MLGLFAFFSPLFFIVGEFHQIAQPIRLDTVSLYRRDRLGDFGCMLVDCYPLNASTQILLKPPYCG